jgi:hypothetical protein
MMEKPRNQEGFAHGGPRSGSGRKKGSPNKLAAEAVEEAVDRVKKAMGEGFTPLEHLLFVMRDEQNEVGVRLEAAKAAAPYVHKKQPQDLNVDANVHVPTVVTMRVVGPRRPAGGQ